MDVRALGVEIVHHFVSEGYSLSDVEMVIRVEIDHPFLGKKSLNVCQWPFMCKSHLTVVVEEEGKRVIGGDGAVFPESGMHVCDGSKSIGGEASRASGSAWKRVVGAFEGEPQSRAVAYLVYVAHSH